MPDLLQTMFEDGYLSSTELVALRKTCKELHENPVRILRSLNIASSEEIQDYFHKFFRFPMVQEATLAALDRNKSMLIPEDVAVALNVFPVGLDDKAILVAMEDPTDLALRHKLQFFLEKRVVPVAATAQQVARAIVKIYEVQPESLNLPTVLESSRGIHPQEFMDDGEDTSDSVGTAANVTSVVSAVARVRSDSENPLTGKKEVVSQKSSGAIQVPTADDFDDVFGSKKADDDDDIFASPKAPEPATLEDAMNSSLALEDIGPATDDNFSMDFDSASLQDDVLSSPDVPAPVVGVEKDESSLENDIFGSPMVADSEDAGVSLENGAIETASLEDDLFGNSEQSESLEMAPPSTEESLDDVFGAQSASAEVELDAMNSSSVLQDDVLSSPDALASVVGTEKEEASFEDDIFEASVAADSEDTNVSIEVSAVDTTVEDDLFGSSAQSESLEMATPSTEEALDDVFGGQPASSQEESLSADTDMLSLEDDVFAETTTQEEDPIFSNTELSLEEDIAGVDAGAEIQDSQPPSVEVGQEISAELIAELSSAVNAVLLKIAQVGDGDEALDFLNFKLADVGAKVTFVSMTNFIVSYGSFSVECSVDEALHSNETLVETLFPAIKKIAKKRVANF